MHSARSLFSNRRLPPLVVAVAAVGVTLAVWQLRVVADLTELRKMDPFIYWLPILELGFAELAEGRLLHWNPYQLGGAPGVAAPAAGLLYPLNLLHLFLPTAQAMGVLTLLHIMMAVFFTAVAARAFRMSWGAAFVGGVSFGFSYILTVIFWPGWLAALAWFPLGIASIEKVCGARDLRWLPVLSLAVAMPLLASAPQTSVYELYAFVVFSMFQLIRLTAQSGSFRDAFCRLIPVGLAVAAGIALAAPQLIPTLELMQHSAREAGTLSGQAILPFGRRPAAEVFRRALVPPAEFSQDYLGAIPFALAFAALAVRRRTLQAFCLFMVVWGALGLLAPPWYLAAKKMVPVLGSFRLPDRVFSLAALGLALLAAAGFDALQSSSETPNRRRIAATLLGVAALVAAFVRYPADSYWIPVALLAVASVTWLELGTKRGAVILALTLPLLVTDLVGFSRNSNQLPFVDDGWRYVRRNSALFSEMRDHARFDRTLLVDSSNYRLDWAARSSLPDRLFTIQDYEPMALGQYADFFSYAFHGTPRPKDMRLPFGGFFDREDMRKPSQRTRRFFQLLSVRYYLVPGMKLFNPNFRLFSQHLTRVELPSSTQGRFAVFEDPDALPRAYAVYDAECFADSGDRLAHLASSRFDPTSTVVLESGCSEESAPFVVPAEVSIQSYAPTEIVVQANMAYPGWLVLTDSYYPAGWQAFVDGEPEPILRANEVVRAVRIPVAQSTVVFRYVPWSFYLGLFIALIPVAAGALCLFRGTFRKHSADAPRTPIVQTSSQ